MAADYSKACDHDETQSTKHGTYCTQCGQRMIDTTELGPVRLPTYDEAMRDARRLHWRAVADSAPSQPHRMSAQRPYYAAWQERPWRAPDAVWRVQRVGLGQPLPALATHWCEDLLGLPACEI